MQTGDPVRPFEVMTAARVVIEIFLLSHRSVLAQNLLTQSLILFNSVSEDREEGIFLHSKIFNRLHNCCFWCHWFLLLKLANIHYRLFLSFFSFTLSCNRLTYHFNILILVMENFNIIGIEMSSMGLECSSASCSGIGSTSVSF